MHVAYQDKQVVLHPYCLQMRYPNAS
jgi:hypothetical protein